MKGNKSNFMKEKRQFGSKILWNKNPIREKMKEEEENTSTKSTKKILEIKTRGKKHTHKKVQITKSRNLCDTKEKKRNILSHIAKRKKNERK